ncbi:ABC transporter ATP-binding protein [Ureaplasma diversum]|uniref:ABC transporter ATP-binding protein n=1 Tax=Ureaplasma diversum TaxID=42094 RepID=UPI001AD811B6|nr:ABC transporter ATP-binding protein [Ureaplasma diversum]
MSFFNKKKNEEQKHHEHVSTIDLDEVLSYHDDEFSCHEHNDDNDVVFELNEVSLGYGKKTIISDLSAKIYRNDFVVVLGPNGSGKSTLIKGLCRINQPSSGHIKYKGKLISRLPLFFLWLSKIGHKIANVFTKNREKAIKTIDWHIKNYKNIQAYKSKELALTLAYVPQLAAFPEATSIYDFVKMGRFPSSNALGINTNPKRERHIIETALKQVGIYDLKDRNLEDLSGGQRQKALIALSLAQDTDTIVLDEPTNHLDIRSQLEIIELLHKLHHKMNKTIVLVIHDINNGLKYAHKVMIMKDGTLVKYGKLKEVINEDLLREVFGVDALIIKNKEEQQYPQVSVTDFKLPEDYFIKRKEEMAKLQEESKQIDEEEQKEIESFNKYKMKKTDKKPQDSDNTN